MWDLWRIAGLAALLGLSATAQRLPIPETGYDQSGGFHLQGPKGLDVHGAYRFEDLCTPNPQPGLSACYRITLVLDDPAKLQALGFAPDLLLNAQVSVWGDPAGHFWWQCGGWTVEMVAISEAIRQQVSWEGQENGFQPHASGTQDINITIGRDTMTFFCRKGLS